MQKKYRIVTANYNGLYKSEFERLFKEVWYSDFIVYVIDRVYVNVSGFELLHVVLNTWYENNLLVEEYSDAWIIKRYLEVYRISKEELIDQLNKEQSDREEIIKDIRAYEEKYGINFVYPADRGVY